MIVEKQYPQGVWIENAKIFFERNQKCGINLIFNGHVYKKEATFKTTTTWVCSKGNGKRLSQNKCRARCITSDNDLSLKLGKYGHNHPPIKLEYI